MKHFAKLAAAQLFSTSSYCAKAGAGLKSADALFRVLIVLFCLALLPAPVKAQADSVCFLSVLKVSDSSHAEEQNVVINDNAQWQSLWRTLFTNTSEKPPLPEIDFTRRTVVAVFQGEQASSGYQISIEEIVETENALDVSVKAFSPGKRCVLLGKVTRPLHIVEIEKTQKEIVIHVKHRIRNCG
jgi:uncharacterized protein (UPF0248 family)